VIRVAALAPAALAAGMLVAGCASGDRAATVSAARPTAPASSRAHHGRQRRPARRRPVTGRQRPVGGLSAADVPNRSLTPGAVLTRSAARVCVSGYASRVRDVPEAEKDAVYARYGVPHTPYQHEVDHLVSLELGGSNALANLWPEPYAGRWGARTKDMLENRLHDLVCAGRVSLPRAQRLEATGWVAAFRRYVGDPPAAPAPSGGRRQPPAGGGASGACTPGYTPCLTRHHGADYDCAGGGGNGPYFTAPGVTYVVTGSDPYGLDANHDGRACG
jgi:hypothetical protein